jgi:hypothetical protein
MLAIFASSSASFVGWRERAGVVVVVGKDDEGCGLETALGAVLIRIGDVRKDVVEGCLYKVVCVDRRTPDDLGEQNAPKYIRCP